MAPSRHLDLLRTRQHIRPDDRPRGARARSECPGPRGERSRGTVVTRRAGSR